MPREFHKLTSIGSTTVQWQLLPKPIHGVGELPVLQDPLLHQRVQNYPLFYQFSASAMHMEANYVQRITSAFNWLSRNHTGSWLWQENPAKTYKSAASVAVHIEREPDRLAFQKKFKPFFHRETLPECTYHGGVYYMHGGNRYKKGNALNQAVVMQAVEGYTEQESLKVWCDKNKGFQLEILGRFHGTAQLFVRGLTPTHQVKLDVLMRGQPKGKFRFDEKLEGYIGRYDPSMARTIQNAMDLVVYPVRSMNRILYAGRLGGIVALRRPELVEKFEEAWPSLCVLKPFERWHFIDPTYKDVLGKEGAKERHPSKRELSAPYQAYVSGQSDVRPRGVG